MGNLIDDLLAFSRLGRKKLRKTEVTLRPLLHTVLSELEHEQDGRRIDIEIGDLPDAWADHKLLRQVFVNLLSNAIKYTRNRDVARIEVSAEEAEGVPCYYVKDNGIGFDMRYYTKLFGVFQRLHRAEDYEGTGVGLAIVQRIVRRHGGRIWATGEVDQGATFYFTLTDRHSDGSTR
jgi:light-regulated signal transduction histidine kinase (bacteriophytochrome)